MSSVRDPLLYPTECVVWHKLFIKFDFPLPQRPIMTALTVVDASKLISSILKLP
jgi:hypothetical protein